MKLVRTVTLTKAEGAATRIFEVDLCEVGDALFVVNFRHGRMGSALRDGSKTPLPVPLESAERIYGKLLDEKKAKGFREAGAAGAATVPFGAASGGPSSAARWTARATRA